MKRTAAVVALFALIPCARVMSPAQEASDVLPAPVAGNFVERLPHDTKGQLHRTSPKLPKDLQQTVNDGVLPPDIDMQRWVVAQPGAKIVVKQEGMYRVTRTELENGGFNVNTDSTNWRLFMEGNEQAIIIGAGDQYIEFYGRGIDTTESDSRVYYLIFDASTAGKRITTRVLRPFGGGVIANSYRAVALHKQRSQYNSNIRNGDAENYFGTFVADQPVIVSFDLPAPDLTAATAIVNVRMQGLFNGAHNVQISLNGNVVGVVAGHDLESFAADFTIPAAFLIDGRNSLRLASTGSQDYTYFDSINVDYAKRYQAQQNRLSFYTPNYRRADVRSFTSPNIRVFDTTFDCNAQLLVNFPIVPDGVLYTVRLPADRGAVMYAVEDSALLQSPSVTFNNPSTLSNQVNAADVIIISHSSPDFMTVAEQWANYRRSSAGGVFRVKTVDIADVYDEFSYGSQSANAIRDFLAYADAHWQAPAPHYVLLIGDASYDPRNYEGHGNWALVPSKAVNLPFWESMSDDAMVPDLNHDNVPDMAIGRIPARSSVEIAAALNKTIAFETIPNWDPGRGGVCAFDSVRPEYPDSCQAFMSHMPAGTPITYVDAREEQAHAHIIAALNGGPYIANYSGHGAARGWGPIGFFSTDDVPLLMNQDRPSIYTMLYCLQGYFIHPVNDSLAEALVRAPNGAAATWASSADMTPDLALALGNRFYEQISLGKIDRMGGLVLDAKSHSLPPGSDSAFSWMLFGDPALKVHP